MSVQSVPPTAVRRPFTSPVHPMSVRAQGPDRPLKVAQREEQVCEGTVKVLSRGGGIVVRKPEYKNRHCVANESGFSLWSRKEAYDTRDFKELKMVGFYNEYTEFVPRFQAENPHDVATYHPQAVRTHVGVTWNYFGFRSAKHTVVLCVPSEVDKQMFKEFFSRMAAVRSEYVTAYPDVVAEASTQTENEDGPTTTTIPQLKISESFSSTRPIDVDPGGNNNGNNTNNTDVQPVPPPPPPSPPQQNVVEVHPTEMLSPEVVLDHEDKEDKEDTNTDTISKLKMIIADLRQQQQQQQQQQAVDNPMLRWAGMVSSEGHTPTTAYSAVLTQQQDELQRLRVEVEEYRRPEYAQAAAEVVRLAAKNRQAEEIITELRGHDGGGGGGGEGNDIVKIRLLKERDASKRRERVLTQQLEMAHRSRDALMTSLQSDLSALRGSLEDTKEADDDVSEAGQPPPPGSLITNTMSHMMNLKLFNRGTQFHTNLWTDAECLSQISSFDDPLPLLSDDGTNRKLYPVVNRTWRFQEPTHKGHQVILSLLVVPQPDTPELQDAESSANSAWALRYRSPTRRPTRRQRGHRSPW